MTDNLNFNDLQERNNKVLSDIGQLQEQEMDLYQQINQADMSPENRRLMVDRINQLSQHRTVLYGSLKDQYEFQNQSVSGNITTLAEQMYAINIVENELNEAKQRLNELINQKNDKLRLVQINTYYGKKYGAYKNIMKIIVFACIPLILLGILGNRGFIPTNLNALLMGIVIVIALFMIGGNIVDLSRRDNMNFDEYDWAFDKNAAPKADGSDRVNPWDLSGMSLTCVGAQCCTEGMTYDSSIKKCVPKGPETPQQTINMGGVYQDESTIGALLSTYAIGVPLNANQARNSNGENVVPNVSNKDGFSNYASV
jgi:hypothetical protein